MRTVTRVSLAALLLSLLAAHGPADAAGIVLDDFETGVSAWRTNDREAAGERPSEICGIFTVARQIEEGVEQAALIEFQRAEGTWASVSLPIDGTLWARQNVGQISMLVKGDGSEQTVDLTLRCLLGEERRDVSYVYRLPLDSDQWQRRAIRLFAFKDPDGNPPDAEAVRNAYLLQVAKTGQWPTLSLRVDEILAEPIPGAEERPPAEQPLSVRMSFDVHATQAPGLGPVLAQVGVNLGHDLGPVLDAPAPSAAMSRAVQQLAPSVVRLRLSDFYDARTGGYDLILLSRAVGWVTEAGAKALVCLTPARLEPADDRPARWDPDFEAAAQKVAALRRGGPHLRYYELFDSPLLRGRFESVEELVTAYNSLAAGVLAADPEARVGGPGLASAWDERVRAFLEGADTLHFLSLKLFGAHNVVATDRELIEAASSGATGELPDQISLEEVSRLAR
ncbi:MAG: hypothetical protein U9Q74_15035, partial [Gemmatimonadota bacterium]|nr:hypothetical protein [Gemmatimonadota bacterium]